MNEIAGPLSHCPAHRQPDGRADTKCFRHKDALSNSIVCESLERSTLQWNEGRDIATALAILWQFWFLNPTYLEGNYLNLSFKSHPKAYCKGFCIAGIRGNCRKWRCKPGGKKGLTRGCQALMNMRSGMRTRGLSVPQWRAKHYKGRRFQLCDRALFNDLSSGVVSFLSGKCLCRFWMATWQDCHKLASVTWKGSDQVNLKPWPSCVTRFAQPPNHERAMLSRQAAGHGSLVFVCI